MLSRRQILSTAALAPSLATVITRASAADVLSAAPASARIYAYVGTYTDRAKSWRGQGVHQFLLDPFTGDLRPMQNSPAAVNSTGETALQRNPNSLALHPTLRVAYAANAFDAGSVSAFRIAANGNLQFVSETRCGGKGPAYVSVHPDGRFLFTANYGSGDVSVLRLGSDGVPLTEQTAAVYMNRDACGGASSCKPGPNIVPQAALSHEGFALSDHDGPHAHMIQSAPNGKFVLAADLGLDRVITYRLDANTGTLSPSSTVAVSEGAGARHFVFHPNGKWFYLVNEEASSIAYMRYDQNSGVLTPVSDTSALPAEFKGTSYASGIRMLPDGQHFVVLNRLHDSIALFRIDSVSGTPSLMGQEWTRGSYPRSCSLDPTGKFLYVCHNRSDNITIFKVGNGSIAFTGKFVAVGSAATIEFFADRADA